MQIEDNAMSLSNIFDVNTSVMTEGNLSKQDKIEKTAANFAAIFVNEMLQSARKANLSEGKNFFDSDGSKMSQKLYDQQIATNLAHDPSFGVTKLIREELEKT